MRQLVYYKDGRQYYWLKRNSSNKCSNSNFLLIDRQEYDRIKHELISLEKQIYPFEIIVFTSSAAATFGIMLTAR